MNRAAGRAAVWRSTLAVVAILLPTAGCSDDDPRPRSAASIPQATAAPSTTNPDPYAVPAVIDEAYISRVLAALDAAAGDVIRMTMKSGSVTEEAIKRMESLYSGPVFDQQLNFLIADSAREFAGYRPDPGNRKTSVSELITATPQCVFVRVKRDFSEVSTRPLRELEDQYVSLARSTSAVRTDLNPTNWGTTYDGFQQDRSRPPNPCTSAS